MPLPFRDTMPPWPNNREMALQRLQHLKGRFCRDWSYHDQYSKFIKNMIDKGHAKKLTTEDMGENKHVWYLPHHGVYQPRKQGKLRVIFEGSSRYMSQSLNELLLRGPDFINSLCGVLCRFCKEPVAFVCNIEQMVLQFRVETSHKDYLRFLWQENDTVDSKPYTYRMTRHMFGAVSSPGCANFALRKIATEREVDFGMDVANFIRRDFNVDDGLKSVATPQEAVCFINRSIALLKGNSLVLHKFLPNSKEVLQKIPPEVPAKEFTNIDIHEDSLPIERTLVSQWCFESDTFQFWIVLNEKPFTRRGVLSTLSSVYDSSGFIAPFNLKGKQNIQDMCMNQLDWDSPIPESLQPQWWQWIAEVKNLDSVVIKRCLKPTEFNGVFTAEIYHFSDAISQSRELRKAMEDTSALLFNYGKGQSHAHQTCYYTQTRAYGSSCFCEDQHCLKSWTFQTLWSGSGQISGLFSATSEMRLVAFTYLLQTEFNRSVITRICISGSTFVRRITLQIWPHVGQRPESWWTRCGSMVRIFYGNRKRHFPHVR